MDMKSLWSISTDVQSFVKIPLACTVEVSYIVYSVETPKCLAV